jgi:hypothetical protein
MIYRIFLTTILMISLVAGIAYSADINENAGTSGLAFLKFPAGARASAMGEAYVAIANDATGNYWNPAGLAFVNGVDVSFMHNEWFQDVRYEFLGGAINDGNHALGLSAIYMTAGDIERREATGESMGTFSAYDWAFSLSYANEIKENISLGITGKMLYEKIHIYEAKGFAVDVGFLYRPELPGAFNGLQVGAAVQNIGPKMKFEEEEFDLPMRTRFGLAYNFPINFMKEMSGVVAIDGVLPNDNDFRTNMGLELEFMNMIALRTGYKMNYDTSDFTAGAGFMMNNYKIDYAFVPYSDDLGDTHKISLGVSF